MAGTNEQQGADFLAQNKKKDGVLTTECGLQYKVLEKGEGGNPAKEDTVTVHYEGKLLDGTVFDSSYKRGEPTSFPLGRVIPGWVEGLQLMQKGAKYRLFIPADLAYGERGAGNAIGPNETLIFDVELIDVKKAGE